MNPDAPAVLATDLAVAVALLGIALRMRGRSRPTAVLVACVAVAWLAGFVSPLALFWHRAVLVHALLAYPGWRPRSFPALVLTGSTYAVCVLAPEVWYDDRATLALALALPLVSAWSLRGARGPQRSRRRWALGAALVWCTVMVVVAVAGLDLGDDRVVPRARGLRRRRRGCLCAVVRRRPRAPRRAPHRPGRGPRRRTHRADPRCPRQGPAGPRPRGGHLGPVARQVHDLRRPYGGRVLADRPLAHTPRPRGSTVRAAGARRRDRGPLAAPDRAGRRRTPGGRQRHLAGGGGGAGSRGRGVSRATAQCGGRGATAARVRAAQRGGGPAGGPRDPSRWRIARSCAR